MAKQHDIVVRLILVGDSSVGKTCMICRFAEGDVELPMGTTVGIDFKMKHTKVEGKRVRIQLWDTAGQERYDTITQQYYRRAQGILLVYDITNEKTFINLQKWVNYVQDYADDEVELTLIGNKCDRKKERRVPTSRGQEFARNLNIPFYETSASKSKNIEKAFTEITKRVMARHRQEYSRLNIDEPDRSDTLSELGDTPTAPERGCCM
ncbi:hypothetical protein CAPTEDRAFT_94333 [Capitella teleta]|uniref:Uncharacterized protein n=1 Tax=Capitella teleta TaxID=283909 RepID=R7U430_CAPTE|nr:hypothetical protein CAPTEDRAFT_94333 [Capitella teleta]|eukprot:ELU01105.1 hypothetical protein CAPTEDRAFT_94333 [Capitella teleta]